MSSKQVSVEQATREKMKVREVVRIGKLQQASSDGKYLDFQMAVKIVSARWNVKFAPIDRTNAETLWKDKFVSLFAGATEHEVGDDGFCWKCVKYHCGDPLDELLTTQKADFKKKAKTVVTCTNIMLEDDGWCAKCGKNHETNERPDVPDVLTLNSMDRKQKVESESASLPLREKLWNMDIYEQDPDKLSDSVDFS